MALLNPWITYIDRSYQQIKTAVITNMQNLVPEITDHTENNLFVRMIGIWSGCIEMLGYYVDNAARESFIYTCELYKSAVKIARSYDYRLKGAVPSSGSVTFTLSQTATQLVIIPSFTELEGADNIKYYTVSTAEIQVGEISVEVPVQQYTNVTTTIIGSSDGSKNQEFIVGANVVDNSVLVTINTVNWSSVETFAYIDVDDSNFECYVQTLDEDKNVVVQFSDGVNGAIPASGQNIEVVYKTTIGAAGNAEVNTIVDIISSISLPPATTISVNNPNPTTGGTGVESLENIKRRVPLSNRTLLRAVTASDFKELAETVAGVSKAKQVYNCGRTVELFIAPIGGGVASNVLKNQVATFLEDKRLVLVEIQVKGAGEVIVKIELTLNVLDAFIQSEVVTEVKQNISDLLSSQQQEIGGKNYIGDVYQIIENTDGVDNSVITKFTPQPEIVYIQSQSLASISFTVPQTSVTTTLWKLIWIAANTYQVYKDGAFVQNAATGQTLVFPEIIFTSNLQMFVGDSLRFYSYPYFAEVLDIIDPSIITSNITDITINASGGI